MSTKEDKPNRVLVVHSESSTRDEMMRRLLRGTEEKPMQSEPTKAEKETAQALLSAAWPCMKKNCNCGADEIAAALADARAAQQAKIDALADALVDFVKTHVDDGCCGPGAGGKTDLPPGTPDDCENCRAARAALRSVGREP